jgi:hypothetical protein
MSISSSNEEEEHEEYETESEDEDEDEADEADEEEMTTTTASSTSSTSLISLLPDSIRVKILNYLGGDDCTLDELIDLTVVSKQFYKDCKRPGIEWKIIPTYIINPRPKSNTRSLLRKLVYNQMENQSKKFNHYKCIKLNCINEYTNDISPWDAQQIHLTNTYYDIDTPERRNRGNKLILDLSLPSSSLMADYRRQVDPSVIVHIIRCLFRNNYYKNKTVDTINLSCIVLPSKDYTDHTLNKLNTLQVKKIIWNHSKCNIYISGYQFYLIQDTIKEFIMNDTVFLVKNREEYNNLSDLINEANENYMFQQFCGHGVHLERLSIKNAKVCSNGYGGSSLSQRIDIPQNVLIKFIRNAPQTLKWFHSDLTQGNTDLLKKERPDIEFM